MNPYSVDSSQLGCLFHIDHLQLDIGLLHKYYDDNPISYDSSNHLLLTWKSSDPIGHESIGHSESVPRDTFVGILHDEGNQKVEDDMKEYIGEVSSLVQGVKQLVR